MKSNTNKPRLSAMLRGVQKSIELFQGQGYNDVYFTAQFIRNGKKQNGIERGDISKFTAQIKTYVESESADTVRLEFFDESTGKSIYAKALTELQGSDTVNKEQPEKASSFGALSGFNGLGEVELNTIVDRRVEVKEQQREFIRLNKENDELRSRNATLESEKEELEATLKAKKDTEYYMGIIGTVFPGLATLFQGTRLANAASFLAGTTDLQGNTLQIEQGSGDSETNTISDMVSEFCRTLTPQEAGIVQLLFMAFEKDRSLMQRALQTISQSPATP